MFADFCRQLTQQVHLTVPDAPLEPSDLDSNLTNRVKNLTSIIFPQRNKFDRVHVTFIENKLMNLPSLTSMLDKYNDGNIPDGVFELISEELYKEHFNNLDIDKQNIIEVLAVYCIVSLVQDSIK